MDINTMLVALLGNISLSDMETIAKLHRACYNEALNGSDSSQMVADKKFVEAINSAVDKMPAYIVNKFNSKII